jgi:transposase
MSLKPCPLQPMPATTARVARAAFPKDNPYLTLRDILGTQFRDEDFVDVFPTRGQPAFCPWRLAFSRQEKLGVSGRVRVPVG